MRVFPHFSVPPKPLVRHGKRTRPHLRVALAAFPIVLLAALSTAGAAFAAGPPAAIVATGLTEPGGVIVDPLGHPWVTDAGGLCRVTDPSAAGPGTVTAQCVSGGGGAAFFDPTPLNPGSGDEVVLVGTGAVNATTVDRDVWDPATGTFDPLDAIDVGMPRVQGVSIGPAGNAYVIAVRDSTVKRIDNITAGNATPTVETVGHSAGVRGAAAIAVGKDAANNATVYLAENVGGGISALHPGNASSVATPTNLGNAGEAFGGLAWDENTGVLYGGSANLAIAGQLIDTIESFPIRPAGAQDVAAATGLGGVGGLVVRPDGTLLAVDDPSGNGNAGEGRMLGTGVPAAQILGGPAASGATNSTRPTFTFSVSGTAECRLAPVEASFRPCSGGNTSDTAAAPLADGAYTFSVRSAGGFPVTRSFTVDTVAPAVAIVSPAEGATTTSSPVFVFSLSEPAGASCRIDTAAFAPCGSPRGFTGIPAGGHTFDVRAVDAAGNPSAIASVHFTVPAGAGGPASPAGNPATPAGAVPGAGVLGANADHAAPRLTLALRGGAARLRGTAITVPFRCNETCVAQARGTISVRGSARLYRLRGASRLLRRGQPGALVVHVPRSALGALHSALHAGRTVSMRLTLRTEDVAGNARTRTASVRVRGS